MTALAVTVAEAVRLSGMSRTRLYNALKLGELTAFKAGRRTLIRHSELEAYMAELPAYRATTSPNAVTESVRITRARVDH